ncbi:hypothetical protein [Paracoccus sp. NSM]|uniref:hypothetical protein n=1 Tax=Paracoccus sp. NSM TaxID=3457784 RepID=UPI004035591D
MRQTSRRFGAADTVWIDDIIQAGVKGAVCPPAGIGARHQAIARMRDGTRSGLALEVVESLPVSEAVKTQPGDWRGPAANWIARIRTRTDLSWRRPNGARCVRFELFDRAASATPIRVRPGADAVLPAMMRRLGGGVHFTHLRDVRRGGCRAIGRLKGLAGLRGVKAAVARNKELLP